MTADQSADRHLVAVFDELIGAIHLTKQMVWSATSAPQRDALQDLLGFVVEQSRAVDEAETGIDGRAPAMASPSSRRRRNLLGEVDNDVQAASVVYIDHLTDLATDVRRRAADIGGGDEAKLLVDIADGLQARVKVLVDQT